MAQCPSLAKSNTVTACLMLMSRPNTVYMVQERGVRTSDGDGTVPLISTGLMCYKGWRGTKLNPSNIPIVSREYKHQPSNMFVDLRYVLYLFEDLTLFTHMFMPGKIRHSGVLHHFCVCLRSCHCQSFALQNIPMFGIGQAVHLVKLQHAVEMCVIFSSLAVGESSIKCVVTEENNTTFSNFALVCHSDCLCSMSLAAMTGQHFSI